MTAAKDRRFETIAPAPAPSAVTKRSKKLFAQWTTVDGKLMCNWIAESDASETMSTKYALYCELELIPVPNTQC